MGVRFAAGVVDSRHCACLTEIAACFITRSGFNSLAVSLLVILTYSTVALVAPIANIASTVV